MSTTTSHPRQPRVLVVAGHPDEQSYSHALARAYAVGAKRAGAQVTLLDLAAADFDPVLRYGYRERMADDPFITHSQAELRACNHLALVFPTWWSAEPSLLKGWFDRVLTPGVAYRYRIGKLRPEQLLAGRTATIITTSHGPAAWTRLAPVNSVSRVGRAVLGYCGMRVTQRLVLGGMEGKADTPQRRRAFLARVARAGARQVERLQTAGN
ncbi:Putative NADPH-quinone reductase (modulator of drug activity B) [Actinomyces bovis]|uniref:NADPH-quinone reductase (Modulator of drug activity B) n=1 Tax=Actinomyces bovis TaxID=1658 RepID=A0ABY1VNH6_9ACTO|nr:NAD(P)H-dependent oxidoreductase [Actinomyces bovis]SPT53499.1 Putative NADPH-quinone reductase (modulator of drug activity B) [Actinomyces bovis]VEG55411.1 Putative NADPH-quinone reductase (modulator of drug activity B) [Actinomyces israelii]